MSEPSLAQRVSADQLVQVGGLAVRIDPAFLDLLRPLDDAERRNLKAALKADGRCVSDLIAAVFHTEPLALPVLIDGHHRTQLVAEIRAEGGLIEEPTVFIKEFDTRFDAINYVASLQGGRRNWEPQDRIRFILEKTDYVQRLKAEALRRQQSGKRQVEAQKSQGRVDVQIALHANVSPTTVKQVRKVLESKNEAVIEQLFSPDPKQRIAIAEAAKRVGSASKAASIQARTARLEKVVLPPLPKRSPLNQIVCADVMEGLRTIKSDSIQLTVTSPPYAVHGVSYDGADGGFDWYDGDYASYLVWMKRVWAEVYRVTQPNGKIVLNIDAGNERDAAQQPSHGMVHNVYADLSVIMREIGWVFRGEHCWFKQNSNGSRPNWGSYAMCSNPRIRRNHEYLLVFQKGNGSLIGDRDLCDLTQAEFEQFTISHWYVKAEQGLDPSHRDFHPCPFPQELVYRCVKLYSYVGSTILDPFVGSGSTAFVAKALNRRFVGIDQSPLYCETAKRSLKTLDGLTTPERIAAIKRFRIADGDRADGHGKMHVDSQRARQRRLSRRSRV